MTPDGAPLPLTHWAQVALAGIRALACSPARLDLAPRTLLGERAALMGLPLPRRVAAGGACRLVDCADGTIALNLPRADDWTLLPALFAGEAAASWDAIAVAAASRGADALVERARLLGLAVARADLLPPPPDEPLPVRRLAPPRRPVAGRAPIVLDLTALWAGPLAGHLLERGGARVIKLESPARPDGARRGNAAFYALLNQHKLCVTADLATAAGRDRLLALVGQSDIVLESSRPRALRQFGIDAEALVAARPGLTWVSITAHGRGEPQANWGGFGDDAAAAAGLCAAAREATGRLQFLGDAIADPLTGIAAAQAAWQGWRSGGGVLAAPALCSSVATALHHDRTAFAAEWQGMLARGVREGYPVGAPRTVDGPVHGVGAQDDWPVEALVAC